VLVAFGLIAWPAQRLKILDVQRQLWEELAWLDVIKVNWKLAATISPALAADHAVSLGSQLSQVTPRLRVQEWVCRLA
jgi:hypothetical protein